MPGWPTDNFQFLTFGALWLSGLNARVRPKVKNYKWSVSQPGVESLGQCHHFGTVGKNELN